jgi:amino acid transporter
VTNSTSAAYLTCDKEDIATIWESTVGIEINEQSDYYGCVNLGCCEAVISYVKSKFDFLAAFSFVAFVFLFVAMISTLYMHKKIKKYSTQILSHKNDNVLLILLIGFTVLFSCLTMFTVPNPPTGPPSPEKDFAIINDQYELYVI